MPCRTFPDSERALCLQRAGAGSGAINPIPIKRNMPDLRRACFRLDVCRYTRRLRGVFSQKVDRRLDPPVKVGQVQFFVGAVNSIVG